MQRTSFSCSASNNVKEYNKGYNYFSGLSDSEIARYQKEAITGHRPTWTVGVNKNAKNAPQQSQQRSGSAGAQARMRDPFGFVDQARARANRQEPRLRKLKDIGGQGLRNAGSACQCNCGRCEVGV